MAALAQRRRDRWLAGLALLAVVGFLVLVTRFWHPVYGFTAFIQLDASNDDVKLTAFREHPVYVYRDTGPYDGMYYAQLALDPTLRDPQFATALDNPAYRARRILPSAAAWILAGTKPAAIIVIYPLLNVAAWLLLALLAWKAIGVRDGRGFVAWAGLLFSAGALCSVRFALTDLIATTIVALALLAAERGHKVTALMSVASAALSRETGLLAVAGLMKAPWFSWKNLVRGMAVVLPLAAWLLYVRAQLGPSDTGWRNFAWPLFGLAAKGREAVSAFTRIPDLWLTVTTLLTTAALVVQAAFFVFHRQPHERWWRLGAIYAVLMTVLGVAVWEGFPGAAPRVLLPLTLAFNVLASRRRAALLWLILGNLTVPSGLLALRDVPHDARELAAAHSGPLAAVARLGGGWFGREETRRHHWNWSQERAILEFESWPRNRAVPLRLEFGARSLAPRTVIVRQDGRELQRFAVGTQRRDHILAVHITGARTVLEFTSPEPLVRESADAHARELGFALYDLRVAVSDR
ncbi:hypothetical protein [Opitutus sp. ER46]|uniref:hypothetical protein n=1 Tax=Opitutus sp. ER46 TaxID=2161864 RepID=UPI000D30ED3A|nr:hypothetical protein [Opitutus sp. ER46]PTX97736.1 hypothetical protein DB354_05495 [Opitutus sp. ER46]